MTDEWRDDAACKGTDIEVWFAAEGQSNPYRHAKRICAACPVFGACRADVDEEERDAPRGLVHGFRAGESRGERIRRRRGIVKPERITAPRPKVIKASVERPKVIKPKAGRRTLTAEQVIEIRTAAATERLADIAQRFEMDLSALAKVVRGQSYAHVPFPSLKTGRMPSRNRKLTPDQVRAIRADPRSLSQVAAEYGLSKSFVSAVRRRQMYDDVADLARGVDEPATRVVA